MEIQMRKYVSFAGAPSGPNEELQQYHEGYLDQYDDLPLLEDSSDEEDLLKKMYFEPDVIDAAAVEPQDDHYVVADLSLLPACTSKDGTT
ncbi:hypothetical protein JTB14_007935 [Gonioctena quinquepunctata]|nr:hypothetical protein JTB14_007935 [Gonioctena quinquepunctata]